MFYIPILILFLPCVLPAQSRIDSTTLEKPKVLLLHSYHQGYLWTDEITRGVREVLGNAVEIDVEFMDFKRHFSEEYLISFKEMLAFKYRDIHYDVIISTDNIAFDFLKKYRDELFGPVPVVFCGVSFLNIKSLEGFPDITGISENNDFEKNIKLIRELYPKRKKLVCILDETTTGKVIRKNLDKTLQNHQKDFQNIEVWSDLTMSDLIRDLSLLGDDYVVYYIIFQRDNRNIYYEYDYVTEMVTKASKEPVFGSWNFQLGHGIIGGYLIRGIDQGRDAGERAASILKGVPAQSIPISLNTTHRYAFDFNKLIDFSLSLKSLPPGSIVINRPENFFYEYSTELTIIIVAFAILLLMIILLLNSIQRRKTSEKALEQLNFSLNDRVMKRTRELEFINASLKETMEKLQKTQKELIRSERMAALGSLVTGVAHEINTPLGVSITTSSYMFDILKNLDEQFKHDQLTEEGFNNFISNFSSGSELIIKNLKKTANLIDSFKNLSFHESGGECREFELKEYMKEIIRTHAMQFNQKRIKIILTGEELTINSFPGSFYNIINNLLINSLIHGFVELSEDDCITITLGQMEGQTGVIEYSDNGQGISPGIREHLFEPFTTTGRTEGKTGLGLFIVYKTVTEKLGGAIDYISPLPDSSRKGVCFRIYFPINIHPDNC